MKKDRASVCGDFRYAVLALSKEKAKRIHSLANEDGWLRMGWNIRVSGAVIYRDCIEFYVRTAGDGETFYSGFSGSERGISGTSYL